MSFGFFSIQGTQSGTGASNRTTLGPFNVAFGSVTDIRYLVLTTGTTTLPVPAGTQGVAIIPPFGNPPGGVTLKFKTVSGDTGTFISTSMPSEIQWDTTNSEVPANIYLVASGTIDVTVQFI